MGQACQATRVEVGYQEDKPRPTAVGHFTMLFGRQSHQRLPTTWLKFCSNKIYITARCLTCLDHLETKHLPELLPRSIVSLTDHRPRSTSCTAGWLNVCGEASSRPSNSAFTGEALIAFFASARFSAICSRRLSCALGEGGRSSSAGSGWGRLAGDFVGDRGFKLLRLG